MSAPSPWLYLWHWSQVLDWERQRALPEGGERMQLRRKHGLTTHKGSCLHHTLSSKVNCTKHCIILLTAQCTAICTSVVHSNIFILCTGNRTFYRTLARVLITTPIGTLQVYSQTKRLVSPLSCPLQPTILARNLVHKIT